MFKFEYKIHIETDLLFIVLTFIFATVPSWIETFGLSALSLALMPFKIEIIQGHFGLALVVPYFDAYNIYIYIYISFRKQLK